MLTSALPEEVQAWLAANDISGLDYLFADATAIETMMRGNPGFMYVKDATVMAKGRKAELFQLDLSFLGWLLLCLIPVVGWALYVWVCPYRELCQLRYFETYCGAPETWQPEQASRDPWDL